MQKLVAEMTEADKKEITEHLPDGQQDDKSIKPNLLSPQLRQAMNSLTEAILTSEENVQMIIQMCDLDADALTDSQDGMEALIKAFAKKYEKK